MWLQLEGGSSLFPIFPICFSANICIICNICSSVAICFSANICIDVTICNPSPFVKTTNYFENTRWVNF